MPSVRSLPRALYSSQNSRGGPTLEVVASGGGALGMGLGLQGETLTPGVGSCSYKRDPREKTLCAALCAPVGRPPAHAASTMVLISDFSLQNYEAASVAGRPPSLGVLLRQP